MQLYSEDSVAFALMHAERLEHEEFSPKILQAMRDIKQETELTYHMDDSGSETLADPVKQHVLIDLFKSLLGALTVIKLDSSVVCGGVNVPLLVRTIDRPKTAKGDKEILYDKCNLLHQKNFVF